MGSRKGRSPNRAASLSIKSRCPEPLQHARFSSAVSMDGEAVALESVSRFASIFLAPYTHKPGKQRRDRASAFTMPLLLHACQPVRRFHLKLVLLVFPPLQRLQQ